MAFCLFIASLFAQNPALSTPKFKGIEITGTVEQFGNKLSEQGFTSKEDFRTIYSGHFAGMNDCLIFLVPVENSNDIATVVVAFGLNISEYGNINGYDTWEKILNDYVYFKDLLTEKYGEPTIKNIGFSEDAFTATSTLKLHSVKEGQCEYFTQWGDGDVDKMVVKLSIEGKKGMNSNWATILLQYNNVEKTKTQEKK